MFQLRDQIYGMNISGIVVNVNSNGILLRTDCDRNIILLVDGDDLIELTSIPNTRFTRNEPKFRSVN